MKLSQTAVKIQKMLFINLLKRRLLLTAWTLKPLQYKQRRTVGKRERKPFQKTVQYKNRHSGKN